MKKIFCLFSLVISVACQNQFEVTKTGATGVPRVEGEHLPSTSNNFIFGLGEGTTPGSLAYYQWSSNSVIEIPSGAGQINWPLHRSRYYLSIDPRNSFSFYDTDQGIMEFNHSTKTTRNVDTQNAQDYDSYTYVSGDSLAVMGASGYKVYQGGASSPLEINTYLGGSYDREPESYGKGFYLFYDYTAGHGAITGPNSSPIILDPANTPGLLARTDQTALLGSRSNLYLLNYSSGTNQRILGEANQAYSGLGYTPSNGYIIMEYDDGTYIPARVIKVNSLTGAYNEVPFPVSSCSRWEIDTHVARGMDKLIIQYINGCEGSSASLMKGAIIDLNTMAVSPFEFNTSGLTGSSFALRSIGTKYVLLSGINGGGTTSIHYVNLISGSSFSLGGTINVNSLVRSAACLAKELPYPLDCHLIKTDPEFEVKFLLEYETLLALDYDREVFFISAYDPAIGESLDVAIIYDQTSDKLYPYFNSWEPSRWMSALFSN